MRIALTGVTGHLGAAVLNELVAKNYDVNILIRGNDRRSYEDLPVGVFQGDILDPDSLVPFFSGCDSLIHCAAYISIDGDRHGIVTRTNVEGVRNILLAARSSGVRRVVHVSSIHAYTQKPVDMKLDESRAFVGPEGYAYDRSKRDGQLLALAMSGSDFEVLTMNPTAIIGPYDYKPSRMGRVVIDLVSGKQTFITPGGFDFCDVRDVAAAVVSGLSVGRAGESYLLSGKWHSLGEIVRELNTLGSRVRAFTVPRAMAFTGVPFARLAGLVTGKEPVYTSEALSAVFDGNRCISSEKAAEELGYRSRPLNDSLADTVTWFRKLGYL